MSSTHPSGAVYGDQFFSYTDALSRDSAAAVVPILARMVKGVTSVADFGCARGTWLAAWRAAGVTNVAGIDGSYVDPDSLLIPRDQFHAMDMNGDINLARRFDLVHSFEVAEHLKPERSADFVASLTRHADIVLFSAAPPGQGGLNHINERPYETWRSLFRAHGFDAYDAVRPEIQDLADVSYWYRYNMVLYANDAGSLRLAPDVQATRIPDNRPILDVSPKLFQLRKKMIRVLPRGMQDWLARAKAASTT
ncbi:MAG TPA: hypothetical protein DC046_12940 [Rhodospirillaceae bacterium]|nr:hypothetical protein [Rhodospirillaceae bacterium]